MQKTKAGILMLSLLITGFSVQAVAQPGDLSSFVPSGAPGNSDYNQPSLSAGAQVEAMTERALDQVENITVENGEYVLEENVANKVDVPEENILEENVENQVYALEEDILEENTPEKDVEPNDDQAAIAMLSSGIQIGGGGIQTVYGVPYHGNGNTVEGAAKSAADNLDVLAVTAATVVALAVF